MIELSRILCPIDFSIHSERALVFAMKIAAWYGAKLEVLHVMPPLPPSTLSELAESCRQLTAKNLSTTVERCRLPHVDVETVVIESAEAPARILEYAERFDADLVVTGSHGRRGVQRALLGSVVEALVHRCMRPILTIPANLDRAAGAKDPAFSRIVCAVDFEPASINALTYALSLAEESDARLTLLHVIATPPALAYAPEPLPYDATPVRPGVEAECVRRLRQLIPENVTDHCTLETAVREGGVSQQLLGFADESKADLIVLGVHGRNAFDLAFFGSNSKDVVRQAHCPILIVPATVRGPMTDRTLKPSGAAAL